jgi:hypothetical protein
MNASRQLQIFGFLVFVLSLIASMDANSAEETIAMAERAKAGVVFNDVTVDGVARPDVGQSLSDSFAAALLKSGDYRVFQLDAHPKAKGKRGDPTLGSTPMSMSNQNVDVTFAFNLVGQADQYRFTLKKIRNSDKEVLEVHELVTRGTVDRVYGLVPQVLMRLQAKKKETPSFPRTQSPAQLAAPIYSAPPAVAPAPIETSGNSSYWASRSAPRENLDNIDFSKIPKALVYQSIGSVQAINENWKFCVIRPKETMRLRANDSIHVLYDDNGKIYADMKIANFDSGRVIADFGNKTPVHHKLFPGDEVFGWAPPLQ